MNCSEVEGRIAPFLRGELDPGRMRGVEVHLEGCATCRGRMREERKTSDAVVPFYLLPHAHGQLEDDENEMVEAHLEYCRACREELGGLTAASDELLKNLGQYQLSRLFRARVMREWQPHRIGKRVRHGQRGLADMIERAEAGNTFSYERHVDRFKNYAYVIAFLQTADWHWASEIAAKLFIGGMPSFKPDLTQAYFLEWLREKTSAIATGDGWGPEGRSIGLSGYSGSRKLRRHRLILGLHEKFTFEQNIPFYLFYVERLGYREIAGLLETDRLAIANSIRLTTIAAKKELDSDAISHPRRRKLWQRD